MSAYWRAAGMSYVRYANLCASYVRGALKEPFKSAAAPREQVYFKHAAWKEGKPTPASTSAACWGERGGD